jgi:hypothetical protein
MSNLAVFKQALDQTQIDSIYNDGMPSDISSLNPAAWYKLDQSANWEADTSGNWQVPDAVSAYPQSFSLTTTPQEITFSKIDLGINNTISCWVKRNNGSGLTDLIFGDNTDTSNADIYINGNQRVYYRTPFVINFFFNISGWGIINQADEWFHLAIVRTGDNATLYLNGDNKLTISGYGTSVSTFVSSIGGDVLRVMDGKLSNAQVWDISLNDTEVETLYNNGTPLTTAIQSANLKGWWKLDDTELFDNTNWSIENQVYPSNYNSALSFNTSESDYIQLPLSTFVYTGEFALSVWVNPTILSNDQVIFGNGSGSDNWLRLSSATQIVFKIASAGSLNFNESSGNDLVVDTWQHLLITRDSSNNVTIYRNGVIFGAAQNSTETLTISSIGYRGLIHYDGELSNIALWDSNQIDEKDNIYNDGTPTNSYTNTPTSWWKLDNLTTGLQDNGSGGNNATNSGTTVANTFVNTESATSSNMTEQSLVNNNVSTLNGESSGMTSGNLVLSDLTRNLPYENYSLLVLG